MNKWRIVQGSLICIAGFWLFFGITELLFWLGDFWGGTLSGSPIPQIIYFGGMPINLALSFGLILYGVTRMLPYPLDRV